MKQPKKKSPPPGWTREKFFVPSAPISVQWLRAVTATTPAIYESERTEHDHHTWSE